MVLKKKVLSLTSILLITALAAGCSKPVLSTKQPQLKKIGITQIVEHPALDATRKGFIDALSEKGFKEKEQISIDFQNAQGDIATTQTIAQNFVSQKKDLIFAISTPSAQAAFNATKELPILVTAVTDPVAAGLVKSLEKPQTNVTGTSDFVSIENQFNLIQKLLPKARKIGFIYNTSEVNTQKQLEEAQKLAGKFSFSVIPIGVTGSNEIASALDAALPKIDVLYTPTDNLVASSMPLIFSKTKDKKIPIIGGEKAHVEKGALATKGVDYYKLGHETGLMAAEVLNGKNPKDIPLKTLSELELVINSSTAQLLGIEIPEDIKSKAVVIGGN